jgi:hypothetical protein
MFCSAYSILKFYIIDSNVSGWTGLPQYAAQIPKLETEATWWEKLGIALPFIAALLLGFGRDVDRSLKLAGTTGQTVVSYSAESRGERLAPIVGYLLRLAISVLGALGFIVLLLLGLFVVYKLGIHAGWMEHPSMSFFYEIRTPDNTVLKRDGGFASQDAAKMAAREDAKEMRSVRLPDGPDVGRILVRQNKEEATPFLVPQTYPVLQTIWKVLFNWLCP